MSTRKQGVHLRQGKQVQLRSSPSSPTLLEFLIPTHACCAPLIPARAVRSWGHRVDSASRHECRELAGSCAPRYFLNETDEVRSCSWDVEEFINVDGDAFRSRGLLDAASVEVEPAEVHDGDSFSYSLLMLPRPIWLGTRWCKLSADRCESRVSLLRLRDLPGLGAGRKNLSSTFPGKTIEVSVWAGCTR